MDLNNKNVAPVRNHRPKFRLSHLGLGAMALLAFLIFPGCQQELENDLIFYQNDFEAGNLTYIKGGELFQFHGNQMLGNYNRGGFVLELKALPGHNYLAVAFDLYIHDSWDGNNNEPDGPDVWVIEVDEAIFETTFANAPCESLYCLKQSYPDMFPMIHEPRTGALEINLPTLCHSGSNVSSTTKYRISKLFAHSGDEVVIRFYDRLVQTNSDDPKCDESWSLDNLQITAVAIR